MSGQETRNKLTDYWADHDIQEGQEFAFLTNLIHQEWTGLSVKGHKALKGLRSLNLRDHMTEPEQDESTRRLSCFAASIGPSNQRDHSALTHQSGKFALVSGKYWHCGAFGQRN